MNFGDAEKIIDSGKKQPFRTFLIIFFLVVIVAIIAYVKIYSGEKAKQHANPSSQLNQANGQGEKTYQTTEGDQSPAIYAEGDVTLIYQGLPKVQREAIFKQWDNSHNSQQQLVDRLLKELDAKDADLEAKDADLKGRKAEVTKWVKKFEELKNIIAKLPEHDEQAIKTKEALTAALIEGDLKKAKGGIMIGPGIRLEGGISIQ